MATKTVVCPECGSAVAPGRYACAECGSLLAAVTAVPRAWGRGASPVEPAEPIWAAEPEAALIEAPAPVEVAALDEPTALREPTAPDEAAALPEMAGFPETAAPAPPAEVAAPAGVTDVVEIVPADAPMPDDLVPTLQPSPAGAPVAAVASSASNPMSSAPIWPPAGDRGPASLPVARTPAGAYLPPSAVLDALDPASASAAGAAGSTTGVAAPSTARQDSHSSGAGLGALLGSLDLAADTPRAIIAVGATIAGLGFLLPWANVLAGAGLLGGYFTQWGLAGPGAWIVVTLLATTAGMALGGARTARWPVRFAAIALAALLLGMLWPYLFGFLGRWVGVWVVLAGAIILVVGAILDSRDRHDPEGPPVG
jgi:hypothetical protein